MKKSIRKYHLFHLLNDYSGSPSVLRQVAELLVKTDDVTIYSSRSEGFLSGIEGANYSPTNYKWSENKVLTLFNFFKVQLAIFFKTLILKKGSVIYINTLLPFGAGLAGKLRGFNVIYHLHEPQVSPKILFTFLKWVAKIASTKQIFVSNYLEKQLSEITIPNRRVIYNSVSSKFLKNTRVKKMINNEDFEVMLACSKKRYKGIYEFIDLAKALPTLKFKLILNSSGQDFNDFLINTEIPLNCKVLSSQADMIPHYASTSLLLNLSDKNEWVESFGLTLIEAMFHGIPVIGPQVGGPKEIIIHEETGYQIDSKNKEELIQTINHLSFDTDLYQKISSNALASCHRFTPEKFDNDILEFLS